MAFERVKEYFYDRTDNNLHKEWNKNERIIARLNEKVSDLTDEQNNLKKLINTPKEDRAQWWTPGSEKGALTGALLSLPTGTALFGGITLIVAGLNDTATVSPNTAIAAGVILTVIGVFCGCVAKAAYKSDVQ